MNPYKSFCLSCSMPLSVPGAKGPSDDYCAYCTDSEGKLKSWEEIVAGAAQYLDSWQQVGAEEAKRRAVRYLTAMPAWAHKADSE